MVDVFVVFVCMFFFYFFFFFSSRRRHTRFDCDWSSDVCSSDLIGVPGQLKGDLADELKLLADRLSQEDFFSHATDFNSTLTAIKSRVRDARSEERRVGKECRSRRWRYR